MTPEQATPPRLHRGIWYMGAKSRVIPGFLEQVLDEELEEGATVVDLLAGSGVVSAFLAGRYRVFANDVQEYAAAITRSLIEYDPRTKDAFLDSLEPHDDLQAAYDRNFQALETLYGPALEEEERLLDEYQATGGGGDWPERYRRFLEDPRANYPLTGRLDPASPFAGAAHLLSEEAVAARRRDPRLAPACLATAYYADVYFGVWQSLQIDSLRVAIEEIDPRDPFAREKRTFYLSALLHAASVATSGTSHFAQPRHLKKDSELRAVARRRSLDIIKAFDEYSSEIAETVESTPHRPGNVVMRADYQELIDSRGAFRFPGKVDLVYLDPPYTADHYSRFYHVLEVLARYDYPELARNRHGAVVRGRYPALEDRFLSGFSHRDTVEDEFRRVIAASAAARAKLVVSYGWPTGLLLRRYAEEPAGGDPVERFEAICRTAYGRVRTLRRPMMHSGQGDSNLRVEELLLVCTRPRGGRGRPALSASGLETPLPV